MLEAQSPPSKSALDPYGAFVSRRPAGGTKLGLGEAAQRALAGTLRPEVMEASAYEVEEARQACLACLEECDVLLAPTLFILPPTPTTRYIVTDGHRRPLRQVLLSGTCFGNVVGGAPALSVPFADLFSLQLIARSGADGSLLSIAPGMLPVVDELTKL